MWTCRERRTQREEEGGGFILGRGKCSWGVFSSIAPPNSYSNVYNYSSPRSLDVLCLRALAAFGARCSQNTPEGTNTCSRTAGTSVSASSVTSSSSALDLDRGQPVATPQRKLENMSSFFGLSLSYLRYWRAFRTRKGRSEATPVVSCRGDVR